MKLKDAVEQYEECMREGGPCLVRNCPLYKNVTIRTDDSWGSEITLKIGGCSLMGKFEDFLRPKKPGIPYEE